MTTKELRALDAWIAEHVFGCKVHHVESGVFGGVDYEDCIHCTGKHPDLRRWDGEKSYSWKPTTDPAAAMEVLKKCAEKTDQMSIVECIGDWVVTHGDGNDPTTPDGEGKTLELAICLFAQKLFSK